MEIVLKKVLKGVEFTAYIMGVVQCCVTIFKCVSFSLVLFYFVTKQKTNAAFCHQF